MTIINHEPARGRPRRSCKEDGIMGVQQGHSPRRAQGKPITTHPTASKKLCNSTDFCIKSIAATLNILGNSLGCLVTV